MKLQRLIQQMLKLGKKTELLLKGYDKQMTDSIVQQVRIPQRMSKIDYLWQIQDGKCQYCNSKMKRKNNCTREHIIPKSKGGSNHIGNIALVCKTCNNNRGNDMTDPRVIELLHTRLTTKWWDRC